MNIFDKYDKDSVYVIKKISNTEDYNYKLIEKRFCKNMLNLTKNNYYGTVNIQIYKVEKRDNDVANEQKSDNILLLHDTSYENALGILEKRFKSPTN